MSGAPFPKTWTCKRQRDGVKCATKNYATKKKCGKCGGERPAKREPKHKAVLSQLTYEQFVELNGGEFCGICLRKPKLDGGKRFNRDHDHRTGQPRGVLCFRCNAALPYWVTPEWLEAAAEYLRRAGSVRAAA